MILTTKRAKIQNKSRHFCLFTHFRHFHLLYGKHFEFRSFRDIWAENCQILLFVPRPPGFSKFPTLTHFCIQLLNTLLSRPKSPLYHNFCKSYELISKNHHFGPLRGRPSICNGPSFLKRNLKKLNSDVLNKKLYLKSSDWK